MESKSRLLVLIKKYYFKNRLSGLLLAALTVIALAVALQQFYIINANTGTRFSLWWQVPFNLFYSLYWFLVFPVIYWVATKFRVERAKALYWISIYFFIPVLLVLVHQILASMVINFSLRYLDIPTLVYKRILRNPWLGLDVIIYFAIMIAIDVFEYRQKNRDDKLKLTQLQGQLLQSRLSALESQLHPHFLFNTLNTVSTLILKKENSEAERMLSLLRGFLETTINGSDSHIMTLEEELRFINHYLEIEKVRFADRLHIVEDVKADVLRANVPNFLLQPIIENAIRYAIGPRKSQGRITMRAGRANQHLKISVEDDGPGLPRRMRGKPNEGVGLRTTRERLTRLFGEDHVFDFDSPVAGGLTVRIEIPFAEDGFAGMEVLSVP